MLDRLEQVREGDGTLLDNAMVLFGSGLRDGNSHDPHNLPVFSPAVAVARWRQDDT